jgi:hypothetical protein
MANDEYDVSDRDASPGRRKYVADDFAVSVQR